MTKADKTAADRLLKRALRDARETVRDDFDQTVAALTVAGWGADMLLREPEDQGGAA